MWEASIPTAIPIRIPLTPMCIHSSAPHSTRQATHITHTPLTLPHSLRLAHHTNTTLTPTFIHSHSRLRLLTLVYSHSLAHPTHFWLNRQPRTASQLQSVAVSHSQSQSITVSLSGWSDPIAAAITTTTTNPSFISIHRPIRPANSTAPYCTQLLCSRLHSFVPWLARSRTHALIH